MIEADGHYRSTMILTRQRAPGGGRGGGGGAAAYCQSNSS